MQSLKKGEWDNHPTPHVAIIAIKTAIFPLEGMWEGVPVRASKNAHLNLPHPPCNCWAESLKARSSAAVGVAHHNTRVEWEKRGDA